MFGDDEDIFELREDYGGLYLDCLEQPLAPVLDLGDHTYQQPFGVHTIHTGGDHPISDRHLLSDENVQQLAQTAPRAFHHPPRAVRLDNRINSAAVVGHEKDSRAAVAGTDHLTHDSV